MGDRRDKEQGNLSEKRAKRAKRTFTFFKQQTILIKKMIEAKDRIPKDLRQFEKFVEELVDWHPSPNVIFTIWNKMRSAEERVSGQRIPTPVIALSDDDNDDCVMISEDPPEICDGPQACYTEYEIVVPKPTYVPLDSDDPLAIRGPYKEIPQALRNITHYERMSLPESVLNRRIEIVNSPPLSVFQSSTNTTDVTLPVPNDSAIIPEVPVTLSNDHGRIPEDPLSVPNDCTIIPEVPVTLSNDHGRIPEDPLSVPNDCTMIPEVPLSESNDSQAPDSGMIGVAEKKPLRTWYLPPIPVEETPTTSAKSTSKHSSKVRKTKNLQCGANYVKMITDATVKRLPTNATEESTKDEKPQPRRRKGKPTLAVQPLKVVPISDPGASSSGSSKRKVESSKGIQTRAMKKNKKVKDEPMTEEQAVVLRQRLLVDKVIELELPKILQAQTGSNISQSVVREQLLKALRSSCKK